MSGRIRGHYRIDSKGRVESLGDVNAMAKPYTIPRSVLEKQPSHRRSHVKQISMMGLSVFVVGVSLLAMMPQIERAILAAQASHLASVRASFIQNHPELEALLAKNQ